MKYQFNLGDTRWRPYILLIVGVFVVSTSSIFIRLAQGQGAPSLVIAAWRMTLATLILTPPAWLRHRADLRRITRGQLGLAVLSGVLLGIHFATWISSLEYTSVVSSVVLVTTNPLWVAAATPFLLRERLAGRTLIGIGLAMVGGVIISAAGGSGSAPIHDAVLLGDMLALIGAVAVAGYLLIGRRLRATIALLPYIWLSYGTAAIVLVGASALTGKSALGLPTSAYLWMTLLALLPQLVGHTIYNYALGFLSAAFVSLTILGEPIGSAILAALFLGEPPQPLQVVGGLFIFAALILATRAESEHATAIKPDPGF